MEKKKKSLLAIHSLIGIAIMLFFRFLPLSLPNVTETGMMVLGVFLGTLYLWTMADPFWSSIICVVALALFGYDTMNSVLASWMGNTTLVQTLFMMVIGGAMAATGVTTHMARFFLTRKITNGRPWLITLMICLGCFFMAAFVSVWAPIFIFWPVLYDIFKELGYEKGEAYPTVAVMLVVIATVFGFPVPPYMGNILILISNYSVLTADLATGAVVVNNAAYLCMAVLLGVFLCSLMVLVAKFILRPDVERLRAINIDMLNKNPLPPMSKRQKVMSVGFILLIVTLLIPCVLPTTIGWVSFLSSNTNGMCVLFTGILAAIHVEGKPVINLPEVFSKEMNWGVFFLCGTALYLGSALTSDATGITAFLGQILSPIFSGMNALTFTIVFLVAAFILTNVCNSLVIALVLQPVMAACAASMGYNTLVPCMLMMYTVLAVAFITPAASPFSAIMFGNKDWLTDSKILYRNAATFSVSALIGILVVGLPLATLFANLIQ